MCWNRCVNKYFNLLSAANIEIVCCTFECETTSLSAAVV